MKCAIPSYLRYLSADAEQIAAWIMEQGVIAAADNVVQLEQKKKSRKNAA